MAQSINEEQDFPKEGPFGSKRI